MLKIDKPICNIYVILKLQRQTEIENEKLQKQTQI